MSNARINGFLTQYFDWLKESSSEEELPNGWSVLSVPFLDRHNDYLQIFAAKDNGSITLSDDGEIKRDLKHSGVRLSGRRREIAEDALKRLGFDPSLVEGDELTIQANETDFAENLHHLFLAMLSLDSLGNMTKAAPAETFHENVKGWLDQNRIAAEPDFVVKGRTELQHVFDFYLPPTEKREKSLILHTLPVPDRLHVGEFIFKVNDTRAELASADSVIAMVNDRGTTSITKELYMALQKSGIRPCRWSRRDEFAPRLAG